MLSRVATVMSLSLLRVVFFTVILFSPLISSAMTIYAPSTFELAIVAVLCVIFPFSLIGALLQIVYGRIVGVSSTGHPVRIFSLLVVKFFFYNVVSLGVLLSTGMLLSPLFELLGLSKWIGIVTFFASLFIINAFILPVISWRLYIFRSPDAQKISFKYRFLQVFWVAILAYVSMEIVKNYGSFLLYGVVSGLFDILGLEFLISSVVVATPLALIFFTCTVFYKRKKRRLPKTSLKEMTIALIKYVVYNVALLYSILAPYDSIVPYPVSGITELSAIFAFMFIYTVVVQIISSIYLQHKRQTLKSFSIGVALQFAKNTLFIMVLLFLSKIIFN